MADFDNLNPPKKITNPNDKREGFQEFPRHLYAPDGSFVVVTDEQDKAEKLKDGYTLLPVPEKAEKPEKAKKAKEPEKAKE